MMIIHSDNDMFLYMFNDMNVRPERNIEGSIILFWAEGFVLF